MEKPSLFCVFAGVGGAIFGPLMSPRLGFFLFLVMCIFENSERGNSSDLAYIEG